MPGSTNKTEEKDVELQSMVVSDIHTGFVAEERTTATKQVIPFVSMVFRRMTLTILRGQQHSSYVQRLASESISHHVYEV